MEKFWPFVSDWGKIAGTIEIKMNSKVFALFFMVLFAIATNALAESSAESSAGEEEEWDLGRRFADVVKGKYAEFFNINRISFRYKFLLFQMKTINFLSDLKLVFCSAAEFGGEITETEQNMFCNKDCLEKFNVPGRCQSVGKILGEVCICDP